MSLILCSRNDRYQGDSAWRLTTALNAAAEAIHVSGRDGAVEVILVDWGSDVHLSEALYLTPSAAALVRFLYISHEVVGEVSGDSKYAEVLALNAGARRARGTYVGRIDQDTVMTAEFVERLFAILERQVTLHVDPARAMFLANRRQIPFRFASLSPSLWCVSRYVKRYGNRLPLMFPQPPDRFYQSYVGIWLLHRDLWQEARGLDEQMIYMNWMEVDMYLRLRSRYPLVNLGELVDHSLYHLDHVHPVHGWEWRGSNRKTNPRRDHEHLPPNDRPNGPDWGLSLYSLRFESYSGRASDLGDRIARDVRAAPIRFVWFVLVSRLHTALDAIRLGTTQVHQAQWPTFGLRPRAWHRMWNALESILRKG